MNILYTICSILFFIVCIPIHSKVLIITTAFNRPEFIEWQDKLFKRFLKDDYEFLVCSDANTWPMQQQMQDMCQKLGLRYLQVPQDVHWCDTPSCRNATAIYYAMSQVGYHHDDLVAVVDSDMFLIRPFSFREYLGDYWAAAVPQYRGHVKYMWVGLMIFDVSKLPERHTLTYSPGIVDGVGTDTGGFTYNYLVRYPQVKWREVSCAHILNIEVPLDYLDEATKNVIQTKVCSEFLADYHFFHYSAGTNWDQRTPGYLYWKNKIFFNYLEEMYNQTGY